ncbi:kinase-like domain-containing protein [Rhizophagus clarus]|uniref:Kinase-like domain-containing protein n=1 Tax=Rhizophagus clarus TaxID=94130 RepID=A0A8H3LS75_9GLOM|nr:kinase-like domain-containing protein [Rhizophagus clarus]
MEELKLSDDVIEQIKDFDHDRLTNEQSLLIDKLILDEELKERYKNNGLCKKCKQPNIHYDWCQSCNAKYSQQNFKNWTSGNNEIDNQRGFATIYKAIWKDGYIESWDSENNQWKRSKSDGGDGQGNFPVVLKCLHNSQDITDEFLREIELNIKINSNRVTPCYGITKNPESNNIMIVMYYAKNGSLRQHLNNSLNLMEWKTKVDILKIIAQGLWDIHAKGLVHRDFHCGNILNLGDALTCITDLGLCRPANARPSQDECKKVYGVLPYVAPEVLRGKEYTQESDIYGFGIIAYEVCTGLPPYHDKAHDEFLAISICKGLRPKSDYKIPQLILDIIKQCWDADPSKRPKVDVLLKKLYDELYLSDDDKIVNEISKQVREANKSNEKLTTTSYLYTGTTLSCITNPQAVYTSRLLDFKSLPEPKNAIDNMGNDNLFNESYSVSIETIDFVDLNLDEITE